MRVALVDLTRIYKDVVQGLGLSLDYQKLTKVISSLGKDSKILGFSSVNESNRGQIKFIEILKNLEWDVYMFNPREVEDENLTKHICLIMGIMMERGHDVTVVTGDYLGIDLALYRESFELMYFSGCLDKRWIRHLRSIHFTDLHRLIDPPEDAYSGCLSQLP